MDHRVTRFLDLQKIDKNHKKKTDKNRKNRRLRHSKFSVFPKWPFLDPPQKNRFFRIPVTYIAFFEKKSAVLRFDPWGVGPEN